jgi:hypothetical protein
MEGKGRNSTCIKWIKQTNNSVSYLYKLMYLAEHNIDVKAYPYWKQLTASTALRTGDFAWK